MLDKSGDSFGVLIVERIKQQLMTSWQAISIRTIDASFKF
jgi:hypothetical protein